MHRPIEWELRSLGNLSGGSAPTHAVNALEAKIPIEKSQAEPGIAVPEKY